MANIRFYFTPGSCTTGIHILLEELDLVFEAYLINLLNGDQHKPDYQQLNPKSTIPTLITPDDLVLTDFLSIAWWLTNRYPTKTTQLDINAQAIQLDWASYVVNSIHGQGFSRIFTPEKYQSGHDNSEQIQQQGRDMVLQQFSILAAALKNSALTDSAFSLFDAAFFYVAFWADRSNIALPENLHSRYQQLLQRPAVQRVLMEEGYHSTVRRHQ